MPRVDEARHMGWLWNSRGGLVLERYPGVFRRIFCGGILVRVKPMLAHRMTGAGVVRVRPRMYSPEVNAFLAEHFVH